MSTVSSAMEIDQPNYCTIFLTRHGETEWNLVHRVQGQSDSPLTPTGIDQAKDLATKLKRIKFSAIFSSDLLRAKRTAEIIALDKELQVKTAQALRERAFGPFEGKTRDEFDQELKKLIDKRDRLSDKQKFSYKLHPQVESDEEIVSRLITFLREIAVAFRHKNILVISHGGIIRAFLIHLGFATYRELPPYSMDNTAYIKLDSDGVDFFIKETFGIHKVEPK